MHRLVIFGKHLCQSGLSCVTAMTKGDFSAITLDHWIVAFITGLVVGIFGLSGTFGKLKNLQNSSIGIGVVSFIGTFFADFFTHNSHYEGEWTEAFLTALGACVLAMIVSYTPIGNKLNKKILEENENTSSKLNE